MEDLGALQDQFDKLNSAVLSLQQTIGIVNNTVKNTANNVNNITKQTSGVFTENIKNLDSFNAKIQTYTSRLVKLNSESKQFNKNLTDLSVKGIINDITKLQNSLNNISTGELHTNLEKLQDSIKNLDLTNISDQLSSLQTSLKSLDINSILDIGIITEELTQIKEKLKGEPIKVFNNDELEQTYDLLLNIRKSINPSEFSANALLRNLDVNSLEQLVSANLSRQTTGRQEQTTQATPQPTPKENPTRQTTGRQEQTSQATPQEQTQGFDMNSFMTGMSKVMGDSMKGFEDTVLNMLNKLSSDIHTVNENIRKLAENVQLDPTKQKRVDITRTSPGTAATASHTYTYGQQPNIPTPSPENVQVTQEQDISKPATAARKNKPAAKEGVITQEDLNSAYDFQNIIEDHTKQMRFQAAERRVLRKISKDIYNIMYDIVSTTDKELALDTDKYELEKKILDVEKQRAQLELTAKNVRFESAEQQQAFNDAIEAQLKNLDKITAGYNEQLDVVQGIEKHWGVGIWGNISKIAKEIPILGKLDGPFKAAAEAAREAAVEKDKLGGTKGIKEEITKVKYQNELLDKRNAKIDKQLNTEKGLSAEALKRANLTKYTGDKTGPAAKKLLLAAKETNKTNQAANAAQLKHLNNLKGGILNMGTGMVGLKAGFTALKPIIRGALGPLGIILMVVDAIKFLVKSFFEADKQTITLARNLGVSRESAREIRRDFARISQSTTDTYITIDNLIKAQSELSTQLGRAGIASESTLRAQTFLTERLKLNGDEAAKITARSEMLGENTEETTKEIINQNAALSKTGKSLVDNKTLLIGISKVSGQIAASFGFSNRAIADGIIRLHKFGLTLAQASTIANGLLDFETSISNELEAELLTGRSLNLEKARMKALTGDIVGATEDVMRQMKGLTAEQRKSPIIMKSLASVIGLSVDELQDAYLLETDRTRQNKELEKIYREQGATEAENYRSKKGLQQSLYNEIEKTVTAEEAYREAISKAKDLFVGLVDSGVIDDLKDSIPLIIQGVADLLGIDLYGEQRKQEMLKAVQSTSQKDLELTGLNKEKYTEIAEKGALSKGLFGVTSDWAFATNPGIEIARQQFELIEKTKGITEEELKKAGTSIKDFKSLLKVALEENNEEINQKARQQILYITEKSGLDERKATEQQNKENAEKNKFKDKSTEEVSNIISQDTRGILKSRYSEENEKANKILSDNIEQMNKGFMDLDRALQRTINLASRKNVMNQEFADQLIQTYGEAAKSQLIEASKSNTYQVQRGMSDITVEDFTIKTHPKDSLVMAGGTKFNEETNALLKELIVAVNKGGNVYIDGNKAGMLLSDARSNMA